jgi:hypothetical protein
VLAKYFRYHTYYLIVKKDHFTLRLLETKQEFRVQVEEGMSSKSLLVGNLRVAKRVLKESVDKLSQGFSFTKPLIVIHPTKILKKELSEVEKKLYLELSRSIKARKTVFHLGGELNFKELEALVDAEDGVDVSKL